MKKWIWVVLVLIVVAGVGVWLSRRGGEESDRRTVAVVRGDVVQEVAFTGRLTAADEVELAFELAGAVTEVAVQEGERVEAGQMLARIDTSAAQLEVAKARADRLGGQEKAYLTWQQAVEALDKTEAENARLLEKRRQAVRDAKAELDQKKVIHQESVREDGNGSKLAETAYAAVLTAETGYHAAQQQLTETIKTVEKSNASAKDTAETARLAYETTEQASGAVAGLSSLEALEQLAAVPLTKSVLTAPIAGVVTRREVEVGEVAQAGKIAFELQTPEALEVVAEVPETDAAKLEVGMAAQLTFDALADEVESRGTVTYVAPAAEIIEGVPTYTVKLSVEGVAPGFKPGLTTNVTVMADRAERVLAVPRRAIAEEGGRKLLRLDDGGEIREVGVETGLVGSDGLVEIRGSVPEGALVVISGPDEE